MTKIERFHINGDRTGSKNGWRATTLYGTIIEGSWKTGEMNVQKNTRFVSKFEFAQAKWEREQELLKRRDKLRWLQELVSNSLVVNCHPYLLRKGLPSIKVRITQRGEIICPIYDISTGGLISAQLISENGGKHFIGGLNVGGGCAVINKTHSKNIIVCEGLATGLAIFEAFGRKDCCILCALSAMNIYSVLSKLKKCSAAKTIIAADNDDVGLRYANKAAIDFGVGIVYPPNFGNDFNDLYQKDGPQIVLNIITDGLNKT